MDKYTLDRLVDYVYDDEHKSWKEAGEPTEGHIFLCIDMLSAWVHKQ